LKLSPHSAPIVPEDLHLATVTLECFHALASGALGAIPAFHGAGPSDAGSATVQRRAGRRRSGCFRSRHRAAAVLHREATLRLLLVLIVADIKRVRWHRTRRGPFATRPPYRG
jgi:hypothetical protein